MFVVFIVIVFTNGFPDKLVVALETIRYIGELGMNYFTSGLQHPPCQSSAPWWAF